jgi:drug/metabolite transporter (DMT)-like permease
VSATSVSALLVKLAGRESPGVVTAMWRNVFAAAVVLPFALARGTGEIRALTPRQRLLLGVSGVALGLHFATWMASLDYTSVASSVFFVTITPIFVSLGSQFILREPVPWPVWIAVLITVCGGTIIVGVDLHGPAGLSELFGDVLALIGALFVTVYLLVGRSLRPKLHLVPYVGAVYTIAAVTLSIAALAMRYRLTAYAPSTWLMFALLALIPSLIGHSSYNWALRHFPSFVISVVNLGEPVVAIVLAYLFLKGETPSATKLVGGAVLLVGIFLAIYFTRRSQAPAQDAPTAAAAGGF